MQTLAFDRSIDQLEQNLLSLAHRRNELEYEFLKAVQEFDIRGLAAVASEQLRGVAQPQMRCRAGNGARESQGRPCAVRFADMLGRVCCR